MKLLSEVEEITPEWLTAALREGGTLDRGQVTSVKPERIAVGVGLMGRLARLTVDYEGADADAPRSIIYKYPIDLPQNRQVADAYRFYRREYDFYEHAAERSPLRTARVYFSQCDDNQDFVLLLEDLASGRPGDQVAGNAAKDATHALTELAKHHAAFWGKTGDMDFLVDINDPVVDQVLKMTITPAAPAMIEAFADLFTPELVEVTHGVVERSSGALNAGARKPATLVHGDFRADNLFYEGIPGGGDLAVIDWQITSRGTASFDLGYHLTQSITTETRKAIERPVVEQFHQTLVDGGVQDYSLDDLWHDYREAALFSLVYPITVCGALDLSEPRAHALARVFLDRSLSAISDLKAGELLDEWT